MRRRQLLAAAGSVAIAGCADFSSIDESTPASSFPSATPVWHVIPPYPFRFDGTLTVPAAALRGWLLADISPKRVLVTGAVIEGGPVNVYFTDERISQPRVPTSTMTTLSEVSTFETTVEYPDSGGSVFIEANQQTTLDLELTVKRV